MLYFSVLWIACFCLISPTFGFSSQICDLECWINHLKLNIPDQNLVTEGYNISISGLNCENINLGSIASHLVSDEEISLALSDITFQCSGTIGIRKISWPHISESSGVAITVDKTSLQTAFVFHKGKDGFADYAKLSSCGSQVHIVDIKLSKGVLEFLWKILQPFVKPYLEETFQDLICEGLGTLVDKNLTTLLQKVNQQIQVQPPLFPSPPVPPGMVNLVNNSVVGLLDYVLNELVGANGTFGLNKIIDNLTNGTGRYSTNLKGKSFTFPISSLSNITIGLMEIEISHLDSWSTFDLFEPTDDYSLSSFTQLDTLNITATFFVNVTVQGILEDTWLYEEGKLTTQLSKNDLFARLQIALNESSLMSLAPNQLTSPGCLVEALNNLCITEMSVNMTVDDLELLALSGEKERELDQAIDNILALFTNSFGPAIPVFINRVVVDYALEELNLLISELISKDYPCASPVAPEKTMNPFFTTIAFSSAGILFLLLSVALFVVKPKKKEISEEKVPFVSEEKIVESSLFTHPRLPTLLKLGIPFLLLANIAMFISSNTGVGASVFIELTIDETKIKLPSLFSFSLANSIRDMWNAGVYPLSILIAVFSGSWPYMKLILMLACWTLPVNVLKLKRRETLLRFLDALGKWSLIDVYVMILMMVAFRFHVSLPTEVGQVLVDVFVRPDYGFHTFIAATMLSLILTHVILGIHRYATREIEVKKSSHKEALCTSAFGGSTSFKHVLGSSSFFILLLVCVALIVVGMVFNSFEFEFKGAAGWALSFLGDNPGQKYSIISLGLSLNQSSEPPNQPGVIAIQITYFIFAIAMPLAHLSMLIFLWLIPLTPSVQRNFFITTEIFNAWSALDVFILSIIAALLEIRQFAQFIVGDKCDLINPLLKKYFDDLLHHDDRCFDVIATLHSGCWILFSSCVIYIITSQVIMRICHKALHERSLRDKGGIQ